jgi:peptidoglycan/LPS O-acetylase OafA/YrhL
LCFQWHSRRIGALAMAFSMPSVLLLTYLTQGWGPMLAAGMAAMVILYGRHWRWSWVTWLGGISYSLYLMHVPIGGRVVNLGVRLPDHRAVEIAVLFLALAASLVAAWCLHRYVEQPAQRWAAAIRYPVVRGLALRAGFEHAPRDASAHAIAD